LTQARSYGPVNHIVSRSLPGFGCEAFFLIHIFLLSSTLPEKVQLYRILREAVLGNLSLCLRFNNKAVQIRHIFHLTGKGTTIKIVMINQTSVLDYHDILRFNLIDNV